MIIASSRFYIKTQGQAEIGSNTGQLTLQVTWPSTHSDHTGARTQSRDSVCTPLCPYAHEALHFPRGAATHSPERVSRSRRAQFPQRSRFRTLLTETQPSFSRNPSP